MLLSRRKLPLNALRAFEAAARHCHMRRAAEELGVTHAALSRQVRLLEESLGVSLFDTAVEARESIYLVTEPEGRLKLRTQVFVEHLQRALEQLGASLDTPGQN